jgi:DNA-binding HxlR family transcriptional regulator
MTLLGKRWTGLIVEVLMNGAIRFTDMAQAIPPLSDRMLAERLRELEAAGIVRRRVFPETPVRIEYSLTEKGRALKPVLEAVHGWADAWVTVPAPPCAETAGGADRPPAPHPANIVPSRRPGSA